MPARYHHRDLVALVLRCLPAGVALPAWLERLPPLAGRLALRRGLRMTDRQITQFAELLEEEAGIILRPQEVTWLGEQERNLDDAAHLVARCWARQDAHRAPDPVQLIHLVEVRITRAVIHA